MKVTTGGVWVADEVVVKVGGKNYWLFNVNVMDSDTRRDATPRAFPTRRVKHVVSKGIRAEINNNLSERLQGTI